MQFKRIFAAYFSPTGNAAAVAEHVAAELGRRLDIPVECFDFTLPHARKGIQSYAPDDLVLFAMPVYAGRLPNKLLPFVQNGFTGNGAAAVALCTYGNRSYGDALSELRDTLAQNGFRVIAGAAVVSEHAFARKLAEGRPDAADMDRLAAFAGELAEKAVNTGSPCTVCLPGNSPAGPYYMPRRLDGEPAVFLKSKPKTDSSKCDNCGLCANVCPMGSISREDCASVPGVCIKCQACVQKCPRGAKFFDNPDFLSHREMLLQNFTARKENEFFL